MGRSRTPSRPAPTPFQAPQGVHLALAVGLPTLFCALTAYWMAGAGPNAQQLVSLAYTVLASLWSSWRLRTKQGLLMRLWLWVMLTLVFYAAQSGFDGLPWPRTFAFEGSHTLWFLLGLFQGQVGALWAGQLAARARLFQLTGGIPDGRELELAVREYQLDADFSKTNKAVLMLSLGLLASSSAVLVSVTHFGRGGLSESLFAAFFGLCLMTGVLLRVYRREMESMMYGRRWTWGEKLAPLGWSLLLAVASGAAACLVLGVGPWFTGLVTPQGDVGPPADTSTTAQTPPLPVRHDVGLAVLMALLARLLRVQNLLLAAGAIIRTVAFLAPWVLAAFLLWPLVRWLASGGRDTRGLLRRWAGLLAEQWAAFVAALRAWWGRPQEQTARSLGTRAAERWLRSFFGATARPRSLPAVEAFLRVVKWGAVAAEYKNGETTREFLDRLAEALPESASDLAQVRDALDRELFGPLLDAPARAALLSRVRVLTSEPPFHDSAPRVS